MVASSCSSANDLLPIDTDAPLPLPDVVADGQADPDPDVVLVVVLPPLLPPPQAARAPGIATSRTANSRRI
jgi:hypothetical protein